MLAPEFVIHLQAEKHSDRTEAQPQNQLAKKHRIKSFSIFDQNSKRSGNEHRHTQKNQHQRNRQKKFINSFFFHPVKFFILSANNC